MWNMMIISKAAIKFSVYDIILMIQGRQPFSLSDAGYALSIA